MKIFNSHPQFQTALTICQRLQAAGFEAVFAGGCVRDALMSKPPKDFDIATSAKPDQIEALFEKTVGVGKAFGVVIVVEENESFEVATFRQDGNYTDGRRPSSVEFSSLKEDALRRDFTINAMFYDPIRKEVIDFVGGQADLKHKVLRTVGEAKLRFAEDHLRILRAIRFASQLNVEIEDHTWRAIEAASATVAHVSRERITEELSRIWQTSHRVNGLERLSTSGVLEAILPEVATSWRQASEKEKLEASLFFAKLEGEMDRVALWSLFFLILPKLALKNFEASIPRLVFSRQVQRGIEFVLRSLPWLFDNKVRLGDKLEKLGGEYGLPLLRVAEAHVQSDRDLETSLDFLVSRLKEVLDKNGKLPAPFLSGEDLIKLGIKKGPQMGSLLNEAYKLQLEGQVNSAEEALVRVKPATGS